MRTLIRLRPALSARFPASSPKVTLARQKDASEAVGDPSLAWSACRHRPSLGGVHKQDIWDVAEFYSGIMSLAKLQRTKYIHFQGAESHD